MKPTGRGSRVVVVVWKNGGAECRLDHEILSAIHRERMT